MTTLAIKKDTTTVTTSFGFAVVADENDFFSFVENAVNDELTPAQLSWATGTMKDIEKDLKKDDTGLEDLDE